MKTRHFIKYKIFVFKHIIRCKILKFLELEHTNQQLKDILKDTEVTATQAINKEMNFWNQQFKSIGEIDCTVCTKKIVTYPFGGGYYREADGSVICSKKCLDKRDH